MAEKRHFDIHVLVLDPNRVWRARRKRELKRSGIGAVRQVSDPVDAIEVMRTTPIDVLVTDQHLELVRFLRASRTRRNSALPMVMVGARHPTTDVREALDAGIDDFVTRDAGPGALCDSIDHVVRRGRRFVEADDFYGPDRRRHMVGPRKRMGRAATCRLPETKSRRCSGANRGPSQEPPSFVAPASSRRRSDSSPLTRWASAAAMNSSRSPSRTAWVLLVSTPVRRSLTS